MRLFFAFALALSAFGQQGRINAGGPDFTDALGQLWQADKFFSGGAVSTGAIPAGVPGYYATSRYGDFSYVLPVPDGRYTVALGFLENVVGPGGRVFNVSINGAVVLPSYDIAADVGQGVPARKVFSAVAAGAGIKIQFVTVTRSARVNAIEYGPEVIPSASFLTGLESAAPQCPAANLTFFYAADTSHLFWCMSPDLTTWHVVGDVRNASPLVTLIGMDKCVGSGPGWDCDGIYRVSVSLPSGGIFAVVGAMAPPDYPGPITWVNIEP